MNMDTTTMIYEQHKNLIYARAHSFHNTTGFPLDELIAQGNYIFMKAVEDYDSARAKFSTLLFHRLNTGFITFTRKNRPAVDSKNVDSPSDSDNPRNIIGFKDEVESLSKEAQIVVGLLLNSPTEALGLNGLESPKKVRGKLINILRDEMGWSWPLIWKCFREIKEIAR